jgi:hypothetical protein
VDVDGLDADGLADAADAALDCRPVRVPVEGDLRPARAPSRVPYIQPATAATMWSSVEAIGGPSFAP